MITKQIHIQPKSRFSECDYRGSEVLLNHLNGRFVSKFKT